MSYVLTFILAWLLINIVYSMIRTILWFGRYPVLKFPRRRKHRESSEK